MFGKLIANLVSLPLDVARVPAKVVASIDEATIDSGLGEAVEEISDATLGEASRSIKQMGADLDDAV